MTNTKTGSIPQSTGFRKTSGVINRKLIELKKQIKTPLHLNPRHNLEVNKKITNLVHNY